MAGPGPQRPGLSLEVSIDMTDWSCRHNSGCGRPHHSHKRRCARSSSLSDRMAVRNGNSLSWLQQRKRQQISRWYAKRAWDTPRNPAPGILHRLGWDTTPPRIDPWERSSVRAFSLCNIGNFLGGAHVFERSSRTNFFDGSGDGRHLACNRSDKRPRTKGRSGRRMDWHGPPKH